MPIPVHDGNPSFWGVMIRHEECGTECWTSVLPSSSVVPEPVTLSVSVNFARTINLPISVRGGGHNVSGSAVCDKRRISFDQ